MKSFIVKGVNLFLFVVCCNQPSQNYLKNTPKRIVCLAPNLIEIVYKLGRGDLLVNRTDYTSYPPQVKKLPSIGGYFFPNIEKILSLSPDIVIGTEIHTKILNLLSQRGITTIQVKIESIEELFVAIKTIAKSINAEVGGDSLIKELKEELDLLKKRKPSLEKRVMIVIAHSGESVIVAGPKTFIGELIEVAGGKNVINEPFPLYPILNREHLFLLNPEIVIEVLVPPQNIIPNEIIRFWQKFPHLKALISKRIYIVENDLLLIPGPRFPEAIKIIQDILIKAQ